MRPLGLEIAFVRLDDGGRDGHGRREAIHATLKIASSERIADRILKVRVEGAHDRALGLVDGEQWKQRCERRMDVHDIIRPVTQDIANLAPQRTPNGDARQRAIAVDGDTLPDANDIRRIDRSGKIRGDDVNVMAAQPRLTREEVNVLADSAEVRIVILRDLSDSESVHGGGPDRGRRVVGSKRLNPLRE